MTVVYLFPGQNSRYPGMIRKLTEIHDPNKDLLELSSAVLGRDLASHYKEGDRDPFQGGSDIQVAVFLANHMFLQILEANGIRAGLSLGLSLGEYNHLVHIGALDFEEALRLVEKRGHAYEAGARGSMASVFHVKKELLEDLIRRTRPVGVVEISNDNSPQQYVVSGQSDAVREVLRILQEEFSVKGVVIEEKYPMHSSLFKPVGEGFRKILESTSFSTPRLPYVPNRLGKIIEKPDFSHFIDLLSTHIYSPVLWRQSIDYVVIRYPEAVFVEVGPKTVLFNLLYKKWHRNRKLCTDDPDRPEEHLRKTIITLKDLGAEKNHNRSV